MSDIDNRWFPPSPHKERVLEAIAQGIAHIVERGHNIPPLLVFEDGGAIELPRVRYQMTRRGLVLVAAEGPVTKGTTRFYDVCGSIDEIKGCIAEANAPEGLDLPYLLSLVEDIRYMLARMARRANQYQAFAHEVKALAEQILSLPRPDIDSAEARIQALEATLESTATLEEGQKTTIEAAAEHVRDLANALEGHLAACKEIAIRIGELYERIKGGRVWPSRTEQASVSDRPSEPLA